MTYRKHYVPKACIGIHAKWTYYFRNDLHSQTSKCLSCEENSNRVLSRNKRYFPMKFSEWGELQLQTLP